jgi:hypothetical protein
VYCNRSTTEEVLSGQISVTLDSILNYTGQTVFTYTNLQPGECRSFNLTGTVPQNPLIQLGATVTGWATITPLNDYKPGNNYSDFYDEISGAYDPNDKIAFNGGRR